MNPDRSSDALVDDELDVLAELVPIAGRDIIELGCGAAKLARSLLERHPDSKVTGLEVDERQHAKNLASPQSGLQFIAAGAQAVPFPDSSFDVALMHRYLGILCAPVYCTKIASKLVRTYTDRHGLKDLTKEVLGRDISKDQQSSDWGAPELSDAQLAYAASDVLQSACAEGAAGRHVGARRAHRNRAIVLRFPADARGA